MFRPIFGSSSGQLFTQNRIECTICICFCVFLRLCHSSLPEDEDNMYHNALLHVTDDCLQILFRLLFSCRKERFEYHSHSRCVVLDHVGDGSARAAISRLDMRNVRNIRPYLAAPAHFHNKVDRWFLIPSDWLQSPTEFNFFSPFVIGRTVCYVRGQLYVRYYSH